MGQDHQEHLSISNGAAAAVIAFCTSSDSFEEPACSTLTLKAMPSFLRSIALTVDEPDPGHFYWVLLESRAPHPDDFRLLNSAPRGTDSYERALHEGVDELRRLCQTGAIGPRRECEGEEENPSGWTPLA